MKVVTPKNISPAMKKFAAELVGEKQEPFFLKIEPVPGAPVERCHYVVRDHIAQHGGTQVYSWSLWEYKPFWFEADFHSLWQNDDGRLHDISPDPDGERRRLLVIDSTREFAGNLVPKRYYVLNRDPRVSEAKKCFEQALRIRAAYKEGEPVAPEDAQQVFSLQFQGSVLLMAAQLT